MREKPVVPPGRPRSRRTLSCLVLPLWPLWLGCAGHQPGTPVGRSLGDAPLINEQDGKGGSAPREFDEPVTPLAEGPRAADRPRPVRAKDVRPAPPPQVATASRPAVLDSPPDDRTPVPYAGPKGKIERKDLIDFLDRPPASFFRNVEHEPRLEGGRFRGWRILSFYPGDARFAGIDLRSGDVVTRVNGHLIEQPDQFFQVWQEMRAARELRVEVLRNGKPHISRWDIVN